MKKDLQSKVSKFNKNRIFKKRWHKVVTALSAVVVFCTVYALLLPAMTLEKDKAAEQDKINNQVVYEEKAEVAKDLLDKVDFSEDESANAEESTLETAEEAKASDEEAVTVEGSASEDTDLSEDEPKQDDAKDSDETSIEEVASEEETKPAEAEGDKEASGELAKEDSDDKEENADTTEENVDEETEIEDDEVALVEGEKSDEVDTTEENVDGQVADEDSAVEEDTSDETVVSGEEDEVEEEATDKTDEDEANTDTAVDGEEQVADDTAKDGEEQAIDDTAKEDEELAKEDTSDVKPEEETDATVDGEDKELAEGENPETNIATEGEKEDKTEDKTEELKPEEGVEAKVIEEVKELTEEEKSALSDEELAAYEEKLAAYKAELAKKEEAEKLALAKKEAEEKAKKEAEAKKLAEEKAKKEAEEKARLEREARLAKLAETEEGKALIAEEEKLEEAQAGLSSKLEEAQAALAEFEAGLAEDADEEVKAKLEAAKLEQKDLIDKLLEEQKKLDVEAEKLRLKEEALANKEKEENLDNIEKAKKAINEALAALQKQLLNPELTDNERADLIAQKQEWKDKLAKLEEKEEKSLVVQTVVATIKRKSGLRNKKALEAVELLKEEPQIMSFSADPASGLKALGLEGATPESEEAMLLKASADLEENPYDALDTEEAILKITGKLPLGVRAEAIELEDTELDGKQILCGYDITLYKDDEVYELTGEEDVTVTVELEDFKTIEDYEYSLYYVSEDGEEEKLESAYAEDGLLEFTTNHFSKYVWTVIGHGSKAVVYLNGESGSDSNSGVYPSYPVKTFAKAMASVRKNGKIVINGTVTVSGEETWDMTDSGVTVYRAEGFYPALIHVEEGGELSLDGVSLSGNRQDGHWLDTNDAMIFNEGTLNLNDGTLIKDGYNTYSGLTSDESNHYGRGGAIFTTGTVNIDGAIFENNQALRGGAIYVKGESNSNRASINLYSGTFTKNKVDSWTTLNKLYPNTYALSGGAIYIDDYVNMDITGGNFIENTAYRGGGAIAMGYMSSTADPKNNVEENRSTLTISNARFIGNSAGYVGGAISINTGKKTVIESAEFRGNYTDGRNQLFNKGNISGGAIYVDGVAPIGKKQVQIGQDGITYIAEYNINGEPGRLEMFNTLIADNYAASGGGFAGCPMSKTEVKFGKGAVIYGNKEKPTPYLTGPNDLTISAPSNQFYGVAEHFVSQFMVGGAQNRWVIRAGELVSHTEGLIAYNDYTELHPVIQNVLNKKYCTVIFRDNYSVHGHGGAIGSNGAVEIGEIVEDDTNIKITKVWETNGRDIPDTIEVDVRRKVGGVVDDTWVQHLTMTKPSNADIYRWEALVDNLDKVDPNGDTYEYFIIEMPVAGYQTILGEVEKDGEDFAVTITNVGVNDLTSAKVRKVWDDAGHEADRPKFIEVQLLQDGKPYGKTVKLNDGNNWSHEWINLAYYAGVKYTVEEVLVPGYTSEVTLESGLMERQVHRLEEGNTYKILLGGKALANTGSSLYWTDGDSMDDSVLWQTGSDGKRPVNGVDAFFIANKGTGRLLTAYYDLIYSSQYSDGDNQLWAGRKSGVQKYTQSITYSNGHLESFLYDGSFVWNGKGHRYLTGDSNGQYLRMTKYKTGASDIVIMKVEENTNSFIITNKWGARPVELGLKKVSEKDNSALDGAEFTIYEEDANGMDILDINDDEAPKGSPAKFLDANGLEQDILVEGLAATGEFQIKNLKPDVVYFIKEKTAPEGYMKLNKLIAFKLDYAGNLVSLDTSIKQYSDKYCIDYSKNVVYIDKTPFISVINSLITYTLPETGGVGTGIFMVLGLLLILGAGVTTLFLKRRAR